MVLAWVFEDLGAVGLRQEIDAMLERRDRQRAGSCVSLTGRPELSPGLRQSAMSCLSGPAGLEERDFVFPRR